MKKLNLFALLFATVFMFTACEKESFEIDENPLEVENFEEGTANIRTSGLPTTIQDLRDAGIAVSNNIANIVNNDLTALLDAAALSANPTRANRRTLRQLGFRGGQIRNQLPRINNEYLALVASLQNQDPDPDPNQDPDPTQNPDPGVDPSLTVEQQAFVDRFSIPQDVLDELIARNSLDNIIEREQTQLSNPANIVALGNDLFEVTVGINQGTGTTRVTRTRAQLEGTFSFQYLFSSLFDTRLQTPNTAETFDRMGREVFQALLDSL